MKPLSLKAVVAVVVVVALPLPLQQLRLQPQVLSLPLLQHRPR